jgi:formimidoylglutamate deiminase
MIENKTTQQTLKFASALVEGEWKPNVSIDVSSSGMIESISEDKSTTDKTSINQSTERLVALPGMTNVHSHAFQRGFAGLSEYRTADRDCFWTWRKQMYEYVEGLDPDSVYLIARQLYQEMLAAGYTWVTEFHYVHNDRGGRPYAALDELSQAICRAAADVGIGLCLLPVLYQRGGFRDEPLVDGQNRFALSNEQYVEVVESCQANVKQAPNQTVGLALHSLRAVDAKAGSEVISHFRSVNNAIPIHIHVAEQMKEVDDCVEVHGKRSVEFLFEKFSVDQHWCLIHATHLTDAEIELIAKSKAVVGLCPTTEANLGDGVFSAKKFLDLGGRISIGGDSHCSVDLREELRILEYGQRLVARSRAILGTETQSVGRRLYELAALGGGQAMGVATGEIKVGNRADFTLVDPQHAAIGGQSNDRLLDRLVFTNVDNPIVGTVIGGDVKISDHQRPS